ncbi:MAG: DNA repair protein RecO [uncultured bacterium]|nr:MAG: DNA repair protein RecO [uncultured bacterium]OGN55536.1 MAG: DNA repair protein RecO [Chlamydiae bacterium RIFCSPHIGHO2_01_FULL_44_39]OGN57747.1 MAG: DNA repair protein RecO [Chlamydiae bacterium RIFCSPHIGHO2_02_FULL_45_9]OGN60050.1 MAG: DNA repair protein RecO [Chlamydiae bacterium RIFCSPHIGHO2_12_FULL_44_59]OGN66223.1 MAG: DNA repair protein RecO [Chlamydiae bacterium RIFCSPLOWO2_01_FULL_44_52]OGN68495.1 MAG: DNA repair protein RecO [Chlamydiae bacterium RIFCSPLOWO2_02_FULL_45_22]O
MHLLIRRKFNIEKLACTELFRNTLQSMIITTGLLLQSIPYLGQQKILKVFTKKEGLLSFFTKKTALTPFCLAEWSYRDTEKELLSLQEAHLLDPLLELKEDYATLRAAGSIANNLLVTQMPNKNSEALFELAYLYLKKLTKSPDVLPASFTLKLLVHEGHFPHERPPQFTTEEWSVVEILALSRSLKQIQETQFLPIEKIKRLLEDCVR